jgi:hypothetical protein
MKIYSHQNAGYIEKDLVLNLCKQVNIFGGGFGKKNLN